MIMPKKSTLMVYAIPPFFFILVYIVSRRFSVSLLLTVGIGVIALAIKNSTSGFFDCAATQGKGLTSNQCGTSQYCNVTNSSTSNGTCKKRNGCIYDVKRDTAKNNNLANKCDKNDIGNCNDKCVVVDDRCIPKEPQKRLCQLQLNQNDCNSAECKWIEPTVDNDSRCLNTCWSAGSSSENPPRAVDAIVDGSLWGVEDENGNKYEVLCHAAQDVPLNNITCYPSIEPKDTYMKLKLNSEQPSKFSVGEVHGKLKKYKMLPLNAQGTLKDGVITWTWKDSDQGKKSAKKSAKKSTWTSYSDQVPCLDKERVALPPNGCIKCAVKAPECLTCNAMTKDIALQYNLKSTITPSMPACVDPTEKENNYRLFSNPGAGICDTCNVIISTDTWRKENCPDGGQTNAKKKECTDMGLCVDGSIILQTTKKSCHGKWFQNTFTDYSSMTCADIEDRFRVCNTPSDINHKRMIENCPSTCKKARKECRVVGQKVDPSYPYRDGIPVYQNSPFNTSLFTNNEKENKLNSFIDAQCSDGHGNWETHSIPKQLQPKTDKTLMGTIYNMEGNATNNASGISDINITGDLDKIFSGNGNWRSGSAFPNAKTNSDGTGTTCLLGGSDFTQENGCSRFGHTTANCLSCRFIKDTPMDSSQVDAWKASTNTGDDLVWPTAFMVPTKATGVCSGINKYDTRTGQKKANVFMPRCEKLNLNPVNSLSTSTKCMPGFKDCPMPKELGEDVTGFCVQRINVDDTQNNLGLQKYKYSDIVAAGNAEGPRNPRWPETNGSYKCTGNTDKDGCNENVNCLWLERSRCGCAIPTPVDLTYLDYAKGITKLTPTQDRMYRPVKTTCDENLKVLKAATNDPKADVVCGPRWLRCDKVTCMPTESCADTAKQHIGNDCDVPGNRSSDQNQIKNCPVYYKDKGFKEWQMFLSEDQYTRECEAIAK